MFPKGTFYFKKWTKEFCYTPVNLRTDFKSTFVFSNNQKLDENSGAGHLIHFNSGGAGFKSSIELTLLQGISV